MNDRCYMMLPFCFRGRHHSFPHVLEMPWRPENSGKNGTRITTKRRSLKCGAPNASPFGALSTVLTVLGPLAKPVACGAVGSVHRLMFGAHFCGDVLEPEGVGGLELIETYPVLVFAVLGMWCIHLTGCWSF